MLSSTRTGSSAKEL